MPQERVVRLEWDRRYLSVLGVENNRLYELRLQTPENVFLEEEDELRRVMDSFRVNKVLVWPVLASPFFMFFSHSSHSFLYYPISFFVYYGLKKITEHYHSSCSRLSFIWGEFVSNNDDKREASLPNSCMKAYHTGKLLSYEFNWVEAEERVIHHDQYIKLYIYKWSYYLKFKWNQNIVIHDNYLNSKTRHNFKLISMGQSNWTHDLTSNSPARVRARKPLYGRFGRFFRSSLSICKPERATPIILKDTWNVGQTWRRSIPVSSTKVPVIDGALSLGIRPIDHEQVCRNMSNNVQSIPTRVKAYFLHFQVLDLRILMTANSPYHLSEI